MYNLIEIEAFQKLRRQEMTVLTLQQLESLLWKSADILRGSVSSVSYKAI